LTEVWRELLWSYGEVQADADYGPAILGLRLDQDSRELSSFEPDVVGPLDLTLDARA
jgi:hypothetical protein